MKDFPTHAHAFTELMIILDGTTTHNVNGQVFHLKKGDILVVDENINHSYTNVNQLKHCNIIFTFSQLSLAYQQLELLEGFQKLIYTRAIFSF